MGQVTLHGDAFATEGELPNTGAQLGDFQVTKQDMSDVGPADFKGKKIVINIFPSVDTPVCATSVKTFNEKLASRDDVVSLCVSRDLPFAMSRFCAAEGIENVICASSFRDDSLSGQFPIRITEGPLKGLFSRAVVVADEEGKIIHTEQVPEIAQEPNYDAVLAAL